MTKKLSTRHHYIPQFLIKGFTNDENLLFVYDKQKDKIFPEPRSPKSIFFENGRNTVSFPDSRKSSHWEDDFFQKLDNENSLAVRKLQIDEVKNIDLGDEIFSGNFLFFLINLFWRLPITDFAFEDLMERVKIESKDIDSEELRKEDWYRKSLRANLFSHTINEIGATKPPTKECYQKLSEFENDVFVLGDFPILYKSVPKLFSDLGYMDFLFAVSSKRIFSQTLEPIKNFTTKNATLFNVYIVEQSVKYVVSRNYELLNKSVLEHKRISEQIPIIPFDKYIFKFL